MYDFINNKYVHTPVKPALAPGKPWSEKIVRHLHPMNGGMAEGMHKFISVNYLREGPFNYANWQYMDKWRSAIVGRSRGGRNHLVGVVCGQSCKFAFQYQKDGPFTAFL